MTEEERKFLTRRKRLRSTLRRLRSSKPSRRHVHMALLATVPPAALFGFVPGQNASPADAVVASVPVADAARTPAQTVSESQMRVPEATPAALEASFYGDEFAGRPTANGETFNPELRTAAHRTLPFGTVVRVTDAVTGKDTVVRINDRGPFHGNREIDLSTAAARDIGMIGAGTAKVILDVVRYA